MQISPQAIQAVALEIFKKPNPRNGVRHSSRTKDQSWKAFFGTLPVVVAVSNVGTGGDICI
jgi:hypothetical protein